MKQFTVMGSHPGNGGVHSAEDHKGAAIKFFEAESGKEFDDATMKEFSHEWDAKAESDEEGTVFFGDYEIKEITEDKSAESNDD